MPPPDAALAPGLPTLREAVRVWARIGCLSFGGPAAQIALLHREAVQDRAWVSNRRFLHALNFCTLLPGPEAMQLATYLGWLMHGVRGGLAAGLLFILPGAAVMLALSLLYAGYGAVPAVAAAFFGLKCAVLALVADALRRVVRRALLAQAAWGVAAAAFAALLAGAPFPAVVLAYAAQDAVEARGWLTPGQMLDGLGLAETTPGPLILVLQFVGFLAGHQAGGPWLGIMAAAVVLWATFVPCFAWVFLGAPFVERLQANAALAGALSAVTAAVVGVIASLALWFALHTLFLRRVAVQAMGLHLDLPAPASLDVAALLLAAATGVSLLRFRAGVVPVLAGCSLAGLALHLAGVR